MSRTINKCFIISIVAMFLSPLAVAKDEGETALHDSRYKQNKATIQAAQAKKDANQKAKLNNIKRDQALDNLMKSIPSSDKSPRAVPK